MKGIIVAIVASALCTAGICFVAFKASPANSATIDGSTEETFKSSIDVLKQALPRPRQEEFEQAMATLAAAVVLPTDGGNPLASIMALSADPGAAARKLRTRVHGMTSSEVIAASVVAAAEAKERGAKLGGFADLATGGLGEARLNANESAAIATLKNISSAQAQCQASGVIDCNTNGQGEYGFFGELSGADAVRNDEAGGVGADQITPPVLSNAFGNVANSTVTRSGYIFQMYLPDKAAVGKSENASGGSSRVSISAGQAEVLWCCYAWPSSLGTSGNRAFFTNQSGDVLASKNTTTRYGAAATPAYDAAFDPTSDQTGIAAGVAANVVGNDGETWIIVN